MSFKPDQHLLNSKMSSKTFKCGIKIPDLKQQLIEYFTQTCDIYEKLFTVIKSPESFFTKPEPLRHPLIFYYGHTAAFFVNKFIDRGLITKRINESYERMFAVGVDEMDWDDLNESHYDWPSVTNAKKFREQVKSLVIEIIQNSQEKQITWDSDLWIVLMGIEHERIHLETSSVIIRRLSINEIDQHDWFKECPHSIKQLSKTPINLLKSVKQFEKKWDRQKQTAQTYGWDNQFGHRVIKTKEFNASQMLVSNGQFFEFYEDNGYGKLQFWTEEGKNWLKSTKTKKPVFWQVHYSNAEEPIYFLRTITQIIEMPWDWPVQVNNLQAQAFCNWKSQKVGKSLKLPTEDEYFAMRSLLPKDLNTWRFREVGNINLEYWLSPNPVNMFQTDGFYDIIGNVWQHTITPIYPFEGFEIHPNYDDFTTPTFDNRHNLIKGGSFISSGNEALYHSRYAFRRHFYQHAGFRYVQSSNSTKVLSANIDQSDESVEKALRINFTEKESYIQSILNFLEENELKVPKTNSLVVGCSVGRLPLELSKHFDHSYGIDYTARYFQMATRLLDSKQLKYRDVDINLDDFNMMEQNYNKVHLYQMNPQNTDSKKINQITFMLIDGLSIRKNTIDRAFVNCLQLCSKSDAIEIIVVYNKNEQNKIRNILPQHFEGVAIEENELKGSNGLIQTLSIKGQLNHAQAH